MTDSLRILAIDTSLGGCSIALWQEDTVASVMRETESGLQSRRLLPMIEELLAKHGVNYSDCDAIACTIGPGGFTGIRVGLAAARALTFAMRKPLIGLTTLEVIAYGSRLRGDILSAINASRGQYYVQRFRIMDTLQPISEAMLVDEKLLPALGHGAKIVQEPPTAENVAALAAQKWEQGQREFPIAPLYIREPDAKLPEIPRTTII